MLGLVACCWLLVAMLRTLAGLVVAGREHEWKLIREHQPRRCVRSPFSRLAQPHLITSKVLRSRKPLKHTTMLSIRSAALAALILALGVVEGFVPVDGSKSSVFVSAPLAMCPGGEKNNDDDPTKVWYAGVADAVQNVLTNSPLNEGKKALVKSLSLIHI